MGLGREIHAELDSTNAEALRRATTGTNGPLWILAHRQTAARGRRGRVWSTLEGNFAASLLLSPTGPPATAALRSFVAALGLRDALADATGMPDRFTLKWPNDVLLDGGKLAGILLESGAGGRLAIGFGVNLAAAPAPADLEPDALPPVALAGPTGLAIAAEDFLGLVAPAVLNWEDRLGAEGFAPLRVAWLARAARLGELLSARMPGREVTGRFETIDETGALVLATMAGRVTLPAADVFFGPVEEGCRAARH